jgi:hypothetical protein
VWGPSARVGVVSGDVQAAKASVSTLHSNVEPGSSDENSKVGVASLTVPVGPESMLVCGLIVSTVKVADGGLGSRLPASSTARTWNV